jgi:hypothetical protein
MEIHIINIYEKYIGLDEPVYDVLINNDCLLRIRKKVYKKWKKGKYIVEKQGCEYVFKKSKSGKLVERCNVGVY